MTAEIKSLTVKNRIEELLARKVEFVEKCYQQYLRVCHNKIKYRAKMIEGEKKRVPKINLAPIAIQKRTIHVAFDTFPVYSDEEQYKVEHLAKDSYEQIFFRFFNYHVQSMEEVIGKNVSLMDYQLDEEVNIPFVMTEGYIYYNPAFNFDTCSDNQLFFDLMSLYIAKTMLNNLVAINIPPKKYRNEVFLVMASYGLVVTNAETKKYVYYNLSKRARLYTSYRTLSREADDETYELLTLSNKWYSGLVLLFSGDQYVSDSVLLQKPYVLPIDVLTNEDETNKLVKVEGEKITPLVQESGWHIESNNSKASRYQGLKVLFKNNKCYIGNRAEMFDEEFNQSLKGLDILESLFD